MKKIFPLLALVLGLSSGAYAWLPQTGHLVGPSTVKKVGVYRTGEFSLVQKDLFFELQNRLVYELKTVPYFDVYDYEKILRYGADWHRDDPAGFLLSFDALVLAEARSNDSVLLKALYPVAGRKEEEILPLKTRADLDKALASIENLVLKRLWFSGEVVSLPAVNRCVLNFGRNFNVRTGDLFVSFVSNLRPSAVMSVETVNDLTCSARVVWFHDPVGEGDTVLRISPDLVQNMHSRYVSVDPALAPSVSEIRRVSGIDGRNVVFSASPHDNAFVVSDADNSFFIDPDLNRSVMIGKSLSLGAVAWKPRSHTIAYTSGNDLFIDDIDRDRKLVLVQSPEPHFEPVNLVFNTTNADEVSEFGWDLHTGRFMFFVRNKGVFLTEGFETVRKFAVRPVYPDAVRLQAEFSGNDEELWIKTPNNYDGYASIFRCRISDAAVLEEWDTASGKRPFLWSADRSGVWDLVADDTGRTNLCLLGAGTRTYADKPVAAGDFSDNGCLALYSGRTLSAYDLTNGKTYSTHWDQIVQESFFPASTIAAASGFIRDTNNDKLVNWKDRRPLYLYDVFTSKILLSLSDDCDQFLGFSSTGEYVFFRKAGSVFYRKLIPARLEMAGKSGQ